MKLRLENDELKAFIVEVMRQVHDGSLEAHTLGYGALLMPEEVQFSVEVVVGLNALERKATSQTPERVSTVVSEPDIEDSTQESSSEDRSEASVSTSRSTQKTPKHTIEDIADPVTNESSAKELPFKEVQKSDATRNDQQVSSRSGSNTSEQTQIEAT